MSYTLNWSQNGVEISFKDEIDYYEIFKAHNEIYGNSKFDDLRYIIINLMKVDNIKISQNQILMITSVDKGASRWNNQIKLSFVIKESETAIKLRVTDYLDNMKDSIWNIKMFNSLKHSLEWSKVN
mgnify:CR=1 FL=1